MKRLVNRAPFLVLLSLAMLFSAAGSAQEPGKSPLPLEGSMEMQAPNPKGANPKPADAERALLAAFDKYEVVGMGAAHGNKDLDDFILHLIRNLRGTFSVGSQDQSNASAGKETPRARVRPSH